MRSVDIAQWSTEMTAQERARLVISLELKRMEGIESVSSETAETVTISPGIAADIHRAWASCPSQQQAEFHRLILLKNLIWITAVWDISPRLIELRGLAAHETLFLLAGRVREDRIRWFVEAMSRLIKEVRHILRLIEAAESKHFNEMQVVGRDQSHPLCTVWLASRIIEGVVKGHNHGLILALAEPEDAEVSTPIPMPVHTLLLDANPAVNEQWVQEQLFEIESFASRCG